MRSGLQRYGKSAHTIVTLSDTVQRTMIHAVGRPVSCRFHLVIGRPLQIGNIFLSVPELILLSNWQLKQNYRKRPMYKKKERNSITNRTCADKVVETIQEVCDLTSSHVTTYDYTPGNGAITKALLQAGVLNIKSFTDPSIPSDLHKVEEQCMGRLSLINKWHDATYMISDIQDILSVSDQDQGSDSPVPDANVIMPDFKVVATLGPSYISLFLFTVLRLCSIQPELVSPGRLQMFLIVNAAELAVIESKHWGRSSGKQRKLIYNLFFQPPEVLLKIPLRNNFAHKPARKNEKKIEGVVVDRTHMSLVKLDMRPDIFQVLQPGQMKDFILFLSECSQRASKRLIPGFEQWNPGFGLYLLRCGYRMHEEFKNLQTEHLVEIFQALLERKKNTEHAD